VADITSSHTCGHGKAHQGRLTDIPANEARQQNICTM